MLTENIDRSKLAWKAYLSLRNIIAFAHSPLMTRENAYRYRQHLCNFIKFFKEIVQKNNKYRTNKNVNPITYKIHRLTHYCRNCQFLGNLYRMSTLRYERAHYSFKRLSSTNKNFKSLSICLASRFVDQATLSNYLPKNWYNKNKAIPILFDDIPTHLQSFFNPDLQIVRVNKAELEGIKFEFGTFFAVTEPGPYLVAYPPDPPYPFFICKVVDVYFQSTSVLPTSYSLDNGYLVVIAQKFRIKQFDKTICF